MGGYQGELGKDRDGTGPIDRERTCKKFCCAVNLAARTFFFGGPFFSASESLYDDLTATNLPEVTADLTAARRRCCLKATSL